jgi:ribosome-associated heat shock protein Hsp15
MTRVRPFAVSSNGRPLSRPSDVSESVRIDSWLWSVRLLKTRSAATAACKAGHVRIGGDRVKAAQAVKVGDEIRVRVGEIDRIVVVSKLLAKRVGAAIAAECYIDKTPPTPPREERVLSVVRDRGAGRPTKRDRREMEKLMGLRD